MAKADLYDLHGELATLRRLIANLEQIAVGPAETAAVSNQITTLVKEVQSLTHDCRAYRIESGEMLDKDSAIGMVNEIIRIITEELRALPNTQNWPQDIVTHTGNVYAGDFLRTLLNNPPDRNVIMEKIAKRLRELVLDDEQNPN